jgi:hypothetical protein
MNIVLQAADPASSPQVVGAIVAAVAAGLVGLANIVVTVWQGHKTRQLATLRDSREQWWERFTWAAEKVNDPDNEDFKYLGTTVLSSLANVDWIQPEDKDLIDLVLEDLTDEVSDEDVEEALSGEDH